MPEESSGGIRYVPATFGQCQQYELVLPPGEDVGVKVATRTSATGPDGGELVVLTLDDGRELSGAPGEPIRKCMVVLPGFGGPTRRPL